MMPPVTGLRKGKLLNMGWLKKMANLCELKPNKHCIKTTQKSL